MANPNPKFEHLLPFQFKKGQISNPNGRAGGKSLKERAKEKLYHMTDEEAEDFLNGLDKKTIWEMAEGKAIQDTKIRGSLTISQVLDQLDGSKTEEQGVEDQQPIQDKE